MSTNIGLKIKGKVFKLKFLSFIFIEKLKHICEAYSESYVHLRDIFCFKLVAENNPPELLINHLKYSKF